MKLEKIIFCGTPEFALPTLQALIDSKYRPNLVITQPDKPKGRRKKLTPPPIKILAKQYGIPVLQPENINDHNTIKTISNLQPEIIITVAYGGFFKRVLRKIPKYGCINLHPSLLPKYRGSSPINAAISNGDKRTGCTIFKLQAKMDAGPILWQSELDISEDEVFTTLSPKLAVQGAKDIMESLRAIEIDKIVPRKQDHQKATYCSKIEKKDTWCNWKITAEKLKNMVRSFAEKPGLTASFRNMRIKLIEISVLPEKSEKPSGYIYQINKKGIYVSTKDYNILLKKVQPAGKKIMDAYAFYLGSRIKTGEYFQNGF